jgi:hypothetical protein
MDERLDGIAQYFLARSTIAEFNPASIDPKVLPHLFVLDVERDAGKRISGLRIRLTGTSLDHAFGRPLKGSRLEEFIHGPHSDGVLRGFHHCAETHEPVWMRQVVYLGDRRSRSIEGVAIYLEPERIYGGVIIGETVNRFGTESFEHKILMPSHR